MRDAGRIRYYLHLAHMVTMSNLHVLVHSCYLPRTPHALQEVNDAETRLAHMAAVQQ